MNACVCVNTLLQSMQIKEEILALEEVNKLLAASAESSAAALLASIRQNAQNRLGYPSGQAELDVDLICQHSINLWSIIKEKQELEQQDLKLRLESEEV